MQRQPPEQRYALEQAVEDIRRIDPGLHGQLVAALGDIALLETNRMLGVDEPNALLVQQGIARMAAGLLVRVRDSASILESAKAREKERADADRIKAARSLHRGV
jgi:hypothetical protein